MKNKLYTSAEAAEILGLSESRICQVCRWNSIGTKLGRDWVLTDADLKKLRVAENRKKVTA
jgi:hypothetical protein